MNSQKNSILTENFCRNLEFPCPGSKKIADYAKFPLLLLEFNNNIDLNQENPPVYAIYARRKD